VIFLTIFLKVLVEKGFNNDFFFDFVEFYLKI